MSTEDPPPREGSGREWSARMAQRLEERMRPTGPDSTIGENWAGANGHTGPSSAPMAGRDVNMSKRVTKWQYAQLCAMDDSYRAVFGSTQVVWQDASGTYDFTQIGLLGGLNWAGDQGWEVVSLARRFNSKGAAVFPDQWEYTLKRRVESAWQPNQT